MMRKSHLTLFFILTITVFFMPSKSAAQQADQIILGGYNLDPPVATSGSGVLAVELENDTLRVYGDFEHLTDQFYGAYIMIGEEGKSGNQLFTLNVDSNEEGTGGVLKAEKNTFALSSTEKAYLKADKLYIVIASYDHPAGEIGGRIEF